MSRANPQPLTYTLDLISITLLGVAMQTEGMYHQITELPKLCQEIRHSQSERIGWCKLGLQNLLMFNLD